jgi:hypothetical protein
MAKKLVVISECNTCPNYDGCYCMHPKIVELGLRIVPDKYEIPQFCPLPDPGGMFDSLIGIGEKIGRIGL